MPIRPFAALLCACLIASPAAAQMRPLDEAELSTVHGQGLIELSNASYNGLDFTRISFGADVQLNANFRNMRLGEYSYSSRNGTGADIDIPLLQFGRMDGTLDQRVVRITNPYIEFVYRNAGDAAVREVVGMRIGFDSIAGDVGLQLSSVSGSLRIDGGAAGVLDSRNDPGGGKRWDGSCTGTCLNFQQFGGVRAGDATGPSRDFWIAAVKIPVQFQPPPGTSQVPDAAQAGFWMNWRDKLAAINVNGAPPANNAALR